MTFACPECGIGARTVDTRTTTEGAIKRRRMCPSGHRFTTFEATEYKANYRAIVRYELRKLADQLIDAEPGQAIPMPADADPIALVTIDG